MQVTNDKIGQLEATQIAPTPSLRAWRQWSAILIRVSLLFCGVLMSSMQRPMSSVMIGRMNILLILNKMNKMLDIADGYALIIEVWVVFTDVRYTTMMMLLARLNLRYLLLMVHMTLMHTLLGKLLLIKSLHAIIFLRMHMLGLLLVSSMILLRFGG
jgi:hypothetical protein